VLPIQQEPWSFPVFAPASPQAAEIHRLFDTVLLVCGGIFAIVAGLVLVALWRFRNREDRTPKQDFGSEKLEIAWIVGPVLVVTWLAVVTVQIVLTINVVPNAQAPSSRDPDLVVIGHQWWWEVRYHDPGLVDANEIHIPTGRKLLVELRSADVVHSFWVPRLARKMDAIPGKRNRIWLEADTPGVYRGWCSEFCGSQHAWMTFRVIAHEPADFGRWVAARQRERAEPETAAAKAGERLFHAVTCADCHSVGESGSRPNIGPDLAHIASRKELAGGALENTPANLARWLADPQAVKPQCRMPNFNLGDRQIQELVAWLSTLR